MGVQGVPAGGRLRFQDAVCGRQVSMQRAPAGRICRVWMATPASVCRACHEDAERGAWNPRLRAERASRNTYAE